MNRIQGSYLTYCLSLLDTHPSSAKKHLLKLLLSVVSGLDRGGVRADEMRRRCERSQAQSSASEHVVKVGGASIEYLTSDFHPEVKKVY